MVKSKKSLRKTLHLSMSFLLLLSTFFPILASFPAKKIKAATLPAGTLVPGQTYDTGNHTYGSSEMQNHANWTFVNKGAGANAAWQSASSTWMNLQNGLTGNSASWAVFNYALDMTKPVTLTGGIKAVVGGLITLDNQAGDGLGVMFTPVSTSQVANGATGGELGIGNLPHSVFAGRDFYYNPEEGDDPTGKSLVGNTSYQVRIATTDATGKFTKSGSSSSGVNPVSWLSMSSLQGGTPGDDISVSWSPTSIGSTTTTGKLTLTLKNNVGGITGLSPQSTQVTYDACTMKNSMSIALVSSTGGNYSTMTGNLSGTFAGSKGTADVLVNYLRKNPDGTTTAMPNMAQSKIKANIGDKIAAVVSVPAGGDDNNYDYIAPSAPAGYSLSVDSAIKVQNYVLSDSNPNVINVYYTPNSQQANFSYAYTPGAIHTPAVPTPVTVKGVTDGQITSPGLPVTPVGYSISGYKAPNGQVYSSLAAALASDTGTTGGSGTFSGNSNTNPSLYVPNTNDFQILLSPDSHSASFNYQYADDTPGYNGNPGAIPPTLPNTYVQAGTTGTTINDPTASLGKIPVGYYAKAIITPDNMQNLNSNFSTVLQKWSYIYYDANNAIYGLESNFRILLAASTQTGSVKFSYVANTPGTDATGQPSTSPTTAGKAAALPLAMKLTGQTNAPLNLPSFKVPDGYAIDHVIAPDGKSYPSLSAATVANPYYLAKANDFTVYLKALAQIPKVHFAFEQSASVTPPSPGDINFQDNLGNSWSALTGTPIPADIVTATNQVINKLFNGSSYKNWNIYQYEDPQGNNYPTAQGATLSTAVAGAGGVVQGAGNTYTVTASYNGTISLQVPEAVDFGLHPISAADQHFTGKMTSALVVDDSRDPQKLTSWKVSVAQTAPLHSLVSNVSFENYLYFNGNILGNTAVNVPYSGPTGTQGTFTVLPASSQIFDLEVPSRLQKADSMTGTITWNLTLAP